MLGKSRVRKNDAAIGIRRTDQRRHGIDDLAQYLAGLAQLLFMLPVVADQSLFECARALTNHGLLTAQLQQIADTRLKFLGGLAG